MQTPLLQVPAPPGNWQTLPRAPQLAESVARFLQVPLTSPKPAWHDVA